MFKVTSPTFTEVVAPIPAVLQPAKGSPQTGGTLNFLATAMHRDPFDLVYFKAPCTTSKKAETCHPPPLSRHRQRLGAQVAADCRVDLAAVEGQHAAGAERLARGHLRAELLPDRP